MVQLVLLVIGIVVAVRLPRVLRLKPEQFPAADREACTAWIAAERSAAIRFIAATVGLFMLQVAAGMVMMAWVWTRHPRTDVRETASMLYTLMSILTFLGMLVYAAIAGSKAKRLKKAAGVTWK